MRRVVKVAVHFGVAATLVLGTAVSMCWAMAGVQWQPGFPLRAGNQVLLMWLPVPGVAGYRVERRDTASGEVETWPAQAGQFVDVAARPARGYVYRIVTVTVDGLPGPGSEAREVVGMPQLVAPGWGGHFLEAGLVNLVWTPVEGAAFYNLYRAAGGQETKLLASVQEPTYRDATVVGGTTYRYDVRAVGASSQESPPSDLLEIRVGTTGVGVEAARALEHRGVEPLGVIRQAPGYGLGEPTDLAWGGDRLFISDQGSRSVLSVTPGGDLLGTFGSRPPDYVGVWGIPWGLGTGPGGSTVAVTFLRSSHVRIFSASGDLLHDVEIMRPKGFDDWPVAPQPMDVAVGPDGDLWVTEYTFGQVVHLDARGQELGRVGTPKQADDAGPFKSPTFLDLDPDTGEVFVVDSLLARVFVIGADGTILRSWSRPKEPEGALNLPKGIAVMPSGDVLVVDGIRSTLQAFAPDGTLRAVYQSEDLDYLDLPGLVSVTVDPATDDLYLLSKIDSTVYRLHPSIP